MRDYSNPAFPSTGPVAEVGMSLRDYFAARAMAALLANPKTDEYDVRDASEWVSSAAYEIADAMLVERAK